MLSFSLSLCLFVWLSPLLWLFFCCSFLFLSSPLFLSMSFPCHLLLPLPFLTPTLPFFTFYQWEVRNSVSVKHSVKQKKNSCFEKCFKSKLSFIALQQIIDEECLFASMLSHSHGLLVVWEYYNSMLRTVVFYKMTLLTPVTTSWDKSTFLYFCFFFYQGVYWLVHSRTQCSSYRLFI